MTNYADQYDKWKEEGRIISEFGMRPVTLDDLSGTSDTVGRVTVDTFAAPLEEDEQARIFQWAADHEHEMPELKNLYANINGQYRPGQKPEPGLKSGVPDMTLAVPVNTLNGPATQKGIYRRAGLYIELKRDGRQGEKNGGLSDSQVDWIMRLRKQGYAVAICYGSDEAIAAIRRYLSGKWEQSK